MMIKMKKQFRLRNAIRQNMSIQAVMKTKTSLTQKNAPSMRKVKTKNSLQNHPPSLIKVKTMISQQIQLNQIQLTQRHHKIKMSHTKLMKQKQM